MSTSHPFISLRHPIVAAPMAGGPSSPALAAAVSAAGGLGFLAAGYRSPDEVRADVAAVRAQTAEPFGLNLFVLAEGPVDERELAAYGSRIEPAAARHGVGLGTAGFDDDAFAEKVELARSARPAVVSFAFGCPPEDVVASLHDAGIAVWVTVTEVDEALLAGRVGADALIVQGVEAGGHRGSFADEDGRGEIALLPLLRLVSRASGLPLVAAGGIGDGAAIAAVLSAGAHAAQIGTAFLRSPEASTSEAHRLSLAGERATALTRAFSGRRARGIVNDFMREHDAAAPAAYPHVNQLTGPLRAAARRAGDAESINLWAGQAYPLAAELPAGELVAQWSLEARVALEQARARLESG